MGSTRGWRSATAVVGAAMLVCGCGSGTDDAGVSAATGATATAEFVEAQHGNLSVSGHISFAQDRHVFSDLTLLMGGESGEGGVAPPGFDTDGWPPPESFDVEAGKRMIFFADVLPDCADDAAQSLVLVVRSTTGHGVTVDDRLQLEVDYLPEVVERFCDVAIHVAPGGQSHADPAGQQAWVDVVLVNSSDQPVTVTSRESTTPAGVHWHAAYVTVPPRGRATIRIEANGPICATRDPLQLGLLAIADGAPVAAPYKDVNTLC
jgi:hypothetical protein